MIQAPLPVRAWAPRNVSAQGEHECPLLLVASLCLGRKRMVCV
jgi:hypothetical protein